MLHQYFLHLILKMVILKYVHIYPSILTSLTMEDKTSACFTL